MRINKKLNKPYQTGVSLLEVLVALFVLAVGLLGVIALQAETIKLNQQAYGSTQAIFVANDAAERMRVNLSAYVDSLNDIQKEEPLNPSLADLLPTNGAYADWKTLVSDAVPGGTGEIAKVGASGTEFKITITYSFDVLDNQKTSSAQDSVEQFQYVLFTTL